MSRRLTGRSHVVLALALLALLGPAVARAVDERGAFVMTALDDTIAVERYERTGERFTGALVFRLPGVRFDYAIERTADHAVARMENRVRPAAAPAASAPTQSAMIEWRADSVFADVEPGSHQRLASRAGSMPYVNPSMLMLQLVVQRAFAGTPPRDSVPVFAVAGGRTLTALVRHVTADSLVVAMGVVEFRLRVRPDGRIVSGEVPTQRVRFVRVDTLPEAVLAMAPQDYAPPRGAPYTAEDVRVPTRGGFDLVGTLTWPDRPGRLPCVLLLTGSGAQERDEALPMLPGYRPFRQIADTLARRGIAVLRLDDRGTGGSGGRFAGSTSLDFANDAEDALRWLAQVKDIDSTRLALLGHSEGGLVAPLVAERGVRLAGMVLLAAPAWTGRRVMESQNAWAARLTPAGTPRDSPVRAAMRSVDSLSAADPWLGFFAAHDPLAVARRLARPPVLLLQGATDRQVAAGQADELARAFRAAGNRDVTARVLPATNHLFLPDASGDPAGYAALGVRAIPPATLGIVADWLARRLVPAVPRGR